MLFSCCGKPKFVSRETNTCRQLYYKLTAKHGERVNCGQKIALHFNRIGGIVVADFSDILPIYVNKYDLRKYPKGHQVEYLFA